MSEKWKWYARGVASPPKGGDSIEITIKSDDLLVLRRRVHELGLSGYNLKIDYHVVTVNLDTELVMDILDYQARDLIGNPIPTQRLRELLDKLASLISRATAGVCLDGSCETCRSGEPCR